MHFGSCFPLRFPLYRFRLLQLRQKTVDFIGALPTHLLGDMPVCIQSKGCGVVAEIFLDGFDIAAGLEGENGVGVAEVMEPEFRSADAGEDTFCIPVNHSVLDMAVHKIPDSRASDKRDGLAGGSQRRISVCPDRFVRCESSGKAGTFVRCAGNPQKVKTVLQRGERSPFAGIQRSGTPDRRSPGSFCAE